MKALVRFFAVIGFLGFLVVVLIGVLAVMRFTQTRSVPSRTILELDLEQGLVEYVPEDPIAQLVFGQATTVRSVVETLEQAAEDDRVAGLIATFGGSTMGLAQVQEIRDAVKRFREAGKFAVAFSETFGEVGPGNGSYYLAAAFDEIYLQASGDIGLTGLISESPFIEGTLEKLSIKPQGDHRYEYKNAFNMFTQKEFTRAHEEAASKLMLSRFGQMVRDIANDRELTEDQVKSLCDRGPHLGEEALTERLVDGIAYRDEVYEKVKARGGDGAELLYFSRYAERAGSPHDSGETIALIYGVGPVGRGPSGFNPIFNSVSMGSDSVTAAFRAAIDDDDVKAILFRVDSPGGSYVASDAIWRETVRAKEAGKPVIVSMGDVAGSGGYFVAMAADKIVAQPATITGSIGVLNTKMVTTEFWRMLGITWDEVHTSDASTMWTGIREYTPSQWKRFQAWLDRVYVDFTAKVAAGRGMTREEVHEVAKGRIWSGEDAKEIGLVDELGGFDVALRLAREAAGIDPEDGIKLRLFPRPKTPFEMFFDDASSSEGTPAISHLTGVLEAVRPLTRALGQSLAGAESQVLSMPAGSW